MALKSVFLIRSLTEARGYSELESSSGRLPQTKEESYVPWAMLGDQVVYAPTGMHNSWRGGGGLRPYDAAISQQRRRICESALGELALREPFYSFSAVNRVSEGVKKFLGDAFSKDPEGTAKIVHDEIGRFPYTAGANRFGRISTADKKSLPSGVLFAAIITTLTSGRVEQKLALQDAVGFAILGLSKIPGGPSAVYKNWGPILCSTRSSDNDQRGRAKSTASAAGTKIAGTLWTSEAHLVPALKQRRDRGVDLFIRDTHRKRHDEIDAFYDDLDTRNLTFGAGLSGTTGSLLQAALAFGGLNGELLKGYMLAVIGYLVGGGMHSYHECMVIAQKAGVPYVPGQFMPSLPNSFLHSADFQAWSMQYYDVVYLGGIHWRYNAGVVPSHLNRQLRS